MEQIEKKIKTLNLVAMILGLSGAGALVLSIFTDAYSIKTGLGNISVSMTSYMSGLIGFIFLVAGCSIAFSLLKLAVPEIITGSVTTLLALFMCWHIKSKEGNGLVRLNISFGPGAFLFVLGAGVILASGILYAVSKSNASKAGIVDENEAKRKKIGKIIGICVGALAALCIVVVLLSAVNKSNQKKEAKNTVQAFMKAAIEYDVDSMEKYLASDVKDKNGLMEAYTPDIMSNAYLTAFGMTLDDLSDEDKATITETSVYFGKSYLKKCNVEDVTVNDDGTYTVKVPATIIDMSNTDKQIQNAAEDITAKLTEEKAAEIYKIYLNYPTDEANKMLMNMLMPDFCSILNDAISSSTEKETEFTIVVSKIDGEYKIPELDYKD
ncbi:MAG: hypothetical protein J6U54_23780 [Clostridiales bacterium]|nr:hypothetical protein [Clostridiales bacterium]